MFGIIGGSEARRLPGASQFPWKEIILAVIVLIAVGAIVFGAKILYSSLADGESIAPAVPVVPAVQQPIAQPFDATQDLRPVQPAPVVLAPVAPKVVDYHGVWTEVRDFDPSTIPVEKGFYNGEHTHNISSGINPNDPTDIPEMTAYAWKLLPHLEGERAVWNKSVQVAAARDETNKDIVLVALDADRYKPYILLSVNGEKSLCKLDLLPVDSNGDDAMATRVVARGETIYLYARDPRPGNHWWEQVVAKSELPCS